MFKSGQTSVTQIERLSRGMLYGTARQRRRARLDEKPSIRALERAQDYLKLPTEAPTVPLLQTPRDDAAVPHGRPYQRRSRRPQLQETPARRIHPFHEHDRRRLSGARNP